MKSKSLPTNKQMTFYKENRINKAKMKILNKNQKLQLMIIIYQDSNFKVSQFKISKINKNKRYKKITINFEKMLWGMMLRTRE